MCTTTTTDAAIAQEFIAIIGSAWMNDAGSGINYAWDGSKFFSRDNAIKRGFQLRESDDFNIGVIENGKLVSLDWMTEVVDSDPKELAEIAEAIGLPTAELSTETPATAHGGSVAAVGDLALELHRLRDQAHRLDCYGMSGAAENIREAADKIEAGWSSPSAATAHGGDLAPGYIRFDWETGDPNRPWDSKVVTHDEMRERYASMHRMAHQFGALRESPPAGGFVVDTGNLRYSLHAAHDCGETEHAQSVMKKLGITYRECTPQSIADQWLFWNCKNIPEKLPAYLSFIEQKPEAFIGHGLYPEDAARINAWTPTAQPSAKDGVRGEAVAWISPEALNVLRDSQQQGRKSWVEVSNDRGQDWHRRQPLCLATTASGLVDAAMVSRALDAQPFTDENNGTRVWQILPLEGEKIMRAALEAAIGGAT